MSRIKFAFGADWAAEARVGLALSQFVTTMEKQKAEAIARAMRRGEWSMLPAV
ncbi:MAG: hypothetical protein ACREQP_15315 [Candidatus Binatia bacterium]